MKLKFKTPNILKKNKPEKNISFVKKMIRKMPEDKRLQIATQMWLGTPLTNTPSMLKPFMRMFEDANKMAPGNHWKKIIAETNDFILNPLNLTTDYKNKILKAYRQEPENLKKLTDFFDNDCKNMKWFKSFIPNDLKESEDREFKAHLDFWLNDDVKEKK
jgi:Asp-tRNA(Asn)/Glu-tRNA(Gln) amidotransferase B subunit